MLTRRRLKTALGLPVRDCVEHIFAPADRSYMHATLTYLAACWTAPTFGAWGLTHAYARLRAGGYVA